MRSLSALAKAEFVGKDRVVHSAEVLMDEGLGLDSFLLFTSKKPPCSPTAMRLTSM